MCSAPTARVSDADGLDAVLESDDDRVGSDERRQHRQRALGVVQLDGEEDDIGRADCGGIALCLHARKMDVPLGALDPKSPRAHRVEVRPPREKGDVGADRGQPSAKVAADPAAPTIAMRITEIVHVEEFR